MLVFWKLAYIATFALCPSDLFTYAPPPPCPFASSLYSAQVIEILGSSAIVNLTGQDPWDYLYAFTTSYPGIWLYRYVNGIDPPKDCSMATKDIM